MLGARRRVGAQESAFREIGRIVLGSVGFTAFALLILALAGVVDARLLPDPRGFIQGGTAYFADHFGLVVAAVTAEAVLAHSAAYLLHKYLARRAGGETIRPGSAW